MTEMDAQATDYKDPGIGVPYRGSLGDVLLQDEQYADDLAHIEENQVFVSQNWPVTRFWLGCVLRRA